MFRSTPACLLLAALLALGPYTMTHAQDRTLQATTTDGTLLSVTAHPAASGTPTMASPAAGVVTPADDANAALKANPAQMEKLVATIRDARHPGRDVLTSGMSVLPKDRCVQIQPPATT